MTVEQQQVWGAPATQAPTWSTQTGSITAASDAFITVRSADGYSHTYVIDADTRRPHQPLQSGQQVTVRATDANGASDATAVLPAR